MALVPAGAFISVDHVLSGLTTTKLNCYKCFMKRAAGPQERPAELAKIQIQPISYLKL